MLRSGASRKMRLSYWLLGAAFLIFAVQVTFFLQDGVLIAGDSDRYIQGAVELITEGSISGKAENYRGYVVFIAALQYLTGDIDLANQLAIILQAFFLAIALIGIFALTRLLYSPLAGGIAALMFATNFYALRWTPYILTEALFIAMVVIACWLTIKSMRERKWILPALVAITMMMFLRPNGVILAPLMMLFLLLSFSRFTRYSVTLVALLAALISWNSVSRNLNDVASHEGLLQQFEQGNVIWGTAHIEMPKLLHATGSDARDVPRYLMSYPLESLTLVVKRLFASWSWYRESYSIHHKFFLGVMIPLIYGLAILGIYAVARQNSRGAYLPALLILGQSVVIALSFANHDHRFINYIMPMVFVYAAAGFVQVGRIIPLPGGASGNQINPGTR